MRANFSVFVLRRVIHLSALAMTMSSQGQISLSAYLSAHPWDTAKGPMIVLEPDSLRSRGEDLSDFERATMQAGGLFVVAPMSMVLIDETFATPSTNYGALDHDSKLTYLLTLLTGDEWARIVSTGISVSDLHGEARAVMQSLLPDPFGWSTWKQGVKTATGTVSSTEREHIRLKLSRGFNFLVNLAGQPKTYESLSSCDLIDGTGDAIDHADKDARNPFGIQPREIVPNKPKQSEIEYASPELNKSVELKSSETVGSLLERVQAVTGVQFHADFRVSGLKVVAFGSTCRAGDVLEGLALAVTGTYRKLGKDYELTSDVEGIGARKVRFAVWEASNAQRIEHRVANWRADIGASGHLSQIAFPAGGRFQPNDAMLNLVRASEAHLSIDMSPTANMSPWVRQAFDQFNIDHPDRPIDASSAALQAEFESSYVLPNGRQLRPEPSLKSPIDYAGLGQTIPVLSGSPKPPYSLAQADSFATVRSAIVQASSPDEAKWLMDLLHRFGFREVWLEATQPEVLGAAADRCVKDGIALRLLVRPWALPGDYRADDEDATILGDRGDQLAVREAQLDVWATLHGDLNIPPEPAYRSLSPLSNANYSRWASLANLARTPNLYGMVFEDLQPFGYEGHRTASWHSLLEKPLGEMSDFGYGIRQRLEFLKAHSLDPIDTVGDWLNLKSDIRQPFFPDNAIDPHADSDPANPRLKALVDAWDSERAATFSKAVSVLFDNLPKNLPGGILVEPARGAINDRAARSIQFEDASAAALTYLSKSAATCLAAQPSRVFERVFRFPEDSARNHAANADRLLFEALTAKASIAFDFRSVRVQDLAAVLDRNFMQVISIQIQKIDH